MKLRVEIFGRVSELTIVPTELEGPRIGSVKLADMYDRCDMFRTADGRTLVEVGGKMYAIA